MPITPDTNTQNSYEAPWLTLGTSNVEGTEFEIWLDVPDNADVAAIAAVIQAHDPNMTLPDPSSERLTRITELLTIGRANWTASQRNEIVELMGQELTT